MDRHLLASLPCCICLSLLLSAAVAADRPATLPAQPPPDLSPLVVQLASPDWSQRDAAIEQVVQLGPGILPVLAGLAANAPDPQVRTSAEAALRRVRDILADGPTLVSYSGSSVHPRLVVEALCRQAGLPLARSESDFWSDRRWKPIDFRAESEPFWGAMLRLCKLAGLEPSYSRRGGALALGREDDLRWAQHPFAVAGPFAVIPGGARLRRPNEPADDDDSGIDLGIFADPRFSIVYRYPVEVSEALDENGQSLFARYRPSTLSRPNGSAWAWAAHVPLEAADGQARPRRIALLRGCVEALAHVHSERLTIPDVLAARGTAYRLGEMSLTVADVERRTDGFELCLNLAWAGQDALSWALQRGVMTGEQFRIIDAAGRQWPCEDFDTDLHPDRIVIRLEYDTIPLKPVGLAIELPTQARRISASFVLKDLPLDE